MMHTLEREQWLAIPIQEAWAFFSTPRNLAKITPGDMQFEIREPFDDAPMFTGQRITYTVRPLFGIPLKWVTCIAAVEAPYRFIDVQIQGPYRHWWHEHIFIEQDEGTLMKDKVEYELPLGAVGDLLHGPLVQQRLKRIFDHRLRTLDQLFGRPGGMRLA